jgi:hypothetical protein
MPPAWPLAKKEKGTTKQPFAPDETNRLVVPLPDRPKVRSEKSVRNLIAVHFWCCRQPGENLKEIFQVFSCAPHSVG